MVSLGLETNEGSILESVTEREMVVRDTIIKILGNRTVDELASIDERTTLKSEIRHAVNSIVAEDGEINRLYFTQYVSAINPYWHIYSILYFNSSYICTLLYMHHAIHNCAHL